MLHTLRGEALSSQARVCIVVVVDVVLLVCYCCLCGLLLAQLVDHGYVVLIVSAAVQLLFLMLLMLFRVPCSSACTCGVLVCILFGWLVLGGCVCVCVPG